MLKKLTRRDFLRVAGTGGLLLTAGGHGLVSDRFLTAHARPFSPIQNPYDPRQATGFVNPLRIPADEGFLGVLQPSSNFTMTAREIHQEIIPGTMAKLLVYEVEQNGKRYLNPTIRLRTGSNFTPTFVNHLTQHSIIHWHGFIVDHKNDGHPADSIGHEESYPYNFRVVNRGATYWYHPHPHQLTAIQVYNGMAGLFIVEDENDDRLRTALDLNFGETEIPLVIQDRRFNTNGSLLYNPSLNEYFMGLLGNVVLVNTSVKPFIDVSTRMYRFRLLNGSNARNYRLAFVNGSEQLPFYIIGNDGGLLDQPYRVNEAHISVAERLDVLVDLRSLNAGDEVFLKSLGVGLNPGMPNGHGHHAPEQAGELSSETELFILKLNVKNKVAYDREIPTHLSDITPVSTAGATTRPFMLTGTRSQWLINGNSFSLNRIPVTVRKGATEIWEINNALNSMPHPMHLHGYQFQVLERINSPIRIRNLAVDGQGRLPTDKGWKDTVLVWPSETVRFVTNFADHFPGDQLFLFHCHILEHEDGGMMINYQVS